MVRLGGNFIMMLLADSELACAHELPDVFVEAAEFRAHFEERFCVLDRRTNFQAITDDAGVVHQFGNFFVAVDIGLTSLIAWRLQKLSK